MINCKISSFYTSTNSKNYKEDHQQVQGINNGDIRGGLQLKYL